ncbi:MAG: hypothetical protein JRC86_00305 [Deltaproteobacteria bacterium]|jgi:phage protein D|nr:hypothetical protein [Deltaproteobacteria bacterium]
MTALSTSMTRAPAECIITVDDTDITDFYPYIVEITVQMSRRAATTASIVLDTFRDEQGEWNIQDSGVFFPWKRIRIEACFGNYAEEIMRGYIKEVEVDYPQDKSDARVIIKCQDESLLLDRHHIRRVWSTEEEQMSDELIAEAIAFDRDLYYDTEPGLRNTSLNQDDTSIRFLKQRAQANGFELFIRQGELHFHSPRLDGDPQPTIMVHAGPATNCLNFTTKYDGHKPDRVRVFRARTRTAKQKNEPVSDSEEDVIEPNLRCLGRTAADSSGLEPEPFEWILTRSPGATSEEITARAQAAANENAWKLTAQGELDGALYGHVLLTHLTVDVDGVGSTYGGRYYVDEVTHILSREGYRQQFKLLRNATGQM